MQISKSDDYIMQMQILQIIISAYTTLAIIYKGGGRGVKCPPPPHLPKILLTLVKFIPMLGWPTFTNSGGANLPIFHRDLLFLPLVSSF
jgi:hypothetical protein